MLHRFAAFTWRISSKKVSWVEATIGEILRCPMGLLLVKWLWCFSYFCRRRIASVQLAPGCTARPCSTAEAVALGEGGLVGSCLHLRGRSIPTQVSNAFFLQYGTHPWYRGASHPRSGLYTPIGKSPFSIKLCGQIWRNDRKKMFLFYVYSVYSRWMWFFKRSKIVNCMVMR